MIPKMLGACESCNRPATFRCPTCLELMCGCHRVCFGGCDTLAEEAYYHDEHGNLQATGTDAGEAATSARWPVTTKADGEILHMGFAIRLVQAGCCL